METVSKFKIGDEVIVNVKKSPKFRGKVIEVVKRDDIIKTTFINEWIYKIYVYDESAEIYFNERSIELWVPIPEKFPESTTEIPENIYDSPRFKAANAVMCALISKNVSNPANIAIKLIDDLSNELKK